MKQDCGRTDEEVEIPRGHWRERNWLRLVDVDPITETPIAIAETHARRDGRAGATENGVLFDV